MSQALAGPLAVISDLHSNQEALEAVMADIRALGVQRLACLGDVVGYGPDPEYCIDMVRGHCEVAILGNHDAAVFDGAGDFNPNARAAVEWTRKQLEPGLLSMHAKRARWRWLQELWSQPKRRMWSEGRFLLLHGSPRDPVREYVLHTDGYLNPDKVAAIFAGFAGVCVGGHTHHPGLIDDDFRFHEPEFTSGSATMPLPAGRKSFVNVGSVGQPRDGDARACYAILEEERVTWRRVAYDFRPTQRKIRERGLPEALARRLELGR